MVILSADDRVRQVHVVLVPSPSKGHTIPFMILTKQLVRCGVRVTFVSSEKHIASLELAKENQEKVQCGMDMVRFVGLRGGPAGFAEAIEEPGDRTMAAMLTEWMAVAMAKASREEHSSGVGEVSTLGDGRSAAPCCIISDMFGGWTHAVAKKFAIPSHVFFTSAASCAAMQLTIPKFLADGILPLPTSTASGSVSVPGIPPLDLHDLPSYLLEEESSIKFKFYMRHILQLSEVACILVNSFYDLEKSVFDSVNAEIQNSTLKIQSFVPIGPLLAVEDQTRAEDRHPAEIWLDTQNESSVIYAAFGTGVFFSDEQIHELAHGLEASEQPFILVLQLSETNNGTECSFLPAFEERTRERGVVLTDWVPQVRILNHPAVGAFMTHCGWNSSLECIAAGVPMLAWPMMAEQKMNCRFLVDTAKLAIEVPKGEDRFVERAELESIVRLMMQESLGSEIRARAKTMSDLAHRAVAPGGSSSKGMEFFLKKLITSSYAN
ncbi:hypothetical protein KC19_3G228900 [Ceratodon purpureus]|uniref:Glycosyltransferase n=1 Tax=Ceratodon purpureus TaxID=3225 RepID=A0A8T0IQ09_CERPU|nr:hypothetical protein KC19_3G228900 [Ceratodon purpureus]